LRNSRSAYPGNMANDLLILVDTLDREIGTEEKVAAHLGQGKLHRAFSLFLWNDKGELLLQQRADGKMLWPGFWSNSVCSHPRKGETILEAAERRLEQELGATAADFRQLTSIIYQAPYLAIGGEHEFCHIVFADLKGEVHPNTEEVKAVCWIRIQDLLKEINNNPGRFTPWFKLELQKLSESNLLPVS
jgi:isopentenyl-diphosphate Delta-isomerase